MASKSKGRAVRARAEKGSVEYGVERRAAEDRPTLIVVRESDAHDRLLFSDMADKTMAHHCKDVPTLAALTASGVDPLDRPQAWDAVVKRRRHSQSCQFINNGMLFLYHLGSAAHVDDDETLNFFTEELIAMVEEHSPGTLRAFNFSRLVRDREHGGRLGNVLQKHRVRVVTSEMTIDMRDPMGPTMWSLVTSLAAQERDSIVSRLLLGRIAASRRNRWPHNADAIPIGYQPSDRQITPDPEAVETVGQVLRLMGDTHLSNAQLVREMGRLGITRPKVRSLYGEEATVADVNQPKDIRRSIETYLELYETGVYVLPVAVTDDARDQVGGLPVQRGGDGANAFIELRYDFGTPHGGWVSPHVFAAIRARMAADDSFVTPAANRRPFSGRPPFQFGDRLLKTDTNTANGYRLLEVTEVSAIEGLPKTITTTIASVEASELHAAVFSGIVGALTDELGVAGKTQRVKLTVAPDGVKLLETRIMQLTDRAAEAYRAAESAGSSRTAESLRKRAMELERERADYEAELTEFLDDPFSRLPSQIAVDVTTLAKAFQAIADLDGGLPTELYQELHALLPVFTLTPTDNPKELDWSVVLELPTTDDWYLRLGPISGRVVVRSIQRRNTSSTRHQELLEAFASGETMDQIAAGTGYSRVDTAASELRGQLIARGIPAACVGNTYLAPIKELRMLIGGVAINKHSDSVLELAGKPLALTEYLDKNFLVPAGVQPEWAGSSLARLLNSSERGRIPWTLSNKVGQQALDLVSALGGSPTLGEFFSADPVTTQSLRLWRLCNGKPDCPPVLQRVEPWILKRRRPAHDNRLQPFQCPHCDDPLTLHLRIFEAPLGLLCESCHRTPTDDFIFPDSYFSLERNQARLNQATKPPAPTRRVPARLELDDVPVNTRVAIIADYGTDLPVLKLLKRHGVSQAFLYKLLGEEGIERRRPYRPRTLQ